MPQNCGEFIPAKSSNGIYLTHTRGETLPDFLEYQISDGVSLLVVDGLKIIEINKKQRPDSFMQGTGR